MLTTWMATMEHAAGASYQHVLRYPTTTQNISVATVSSQMLILQAGSHMWQEKLKHSPFREKVWSQELMFPICVAMEVT